MSLADKIEIAKRLVVLFKKKKKWEDIGKIIRIQGGDSFYRTVRDRVMYLAGVHGWDPNQIKVLQCINDNTKESGCMLLMDGRMMSPIYPSKILAEYDREEVESE